MAVFINNEVRDDARAVLTNSPGTAGLTFSVDDIALLGFVNADVPFMATPVTLLTHNSLNEIKEIVQVTAISSDTGASNLTVVRAQEGTTAIDFSTGDFLVIRLTANHVNTIGSQLVGIDLQANEALISANTAKLTADETNVLAALDGATITAATVLGDDKIIGQDTSDSDNTKTFTAQSIANLSESLLFSARISEAAGFSKGQVAYISGSTGTQMTASLADNTDFDKSHVIALANEAGANNATIKFIAAGIIENIDTSSFTEGNTIWLTTAGDLTGTHPSGIDAVVEVGICVRSHATLGSLFVHIDSQTIAENFDGVVRDQVVNSSTGTGAVASGTYVNDAGHRASVSITGSNFTAASEEVTFFNEGYGPTNYVNNGNQPHEWFTEVGDTHIPANLAMVMQLLPGGTLVNKVGADVASATALPLIGDGNTATVTGTTTITSFNSVGVGVMMRLRFAGILILTHQATDLQLPGGANITTAVGDIGIFEEYASGDWRCVSWQSAFVNDHGGLTGLADDDHPQYAKLAGDTFTGDIEIAKSTPAILINNTAAGVDEKYWKLFSDSGTLKLLLGNDALSIFGECINITRTGAGADLLTLAPPVEFPGGIVSTLNGDIDITPNGTGRTRITGLEAPVALETQTGTTFTAFTLDHAEEMITMNNASANTATLPANASIAYPIGTKIHFQQLGAGATTIAITTDTLNVNSNLTLVLNGQYAVATAMKMTATTWTLFGNLVAA